MRGPQQRIVDDLSRAAAGPQVRTADSARTSSLKYDSLRGTVSAYDATNKVATLTPTAVLPSDAKVPPDPVKVFDKYNEVPSISDEVWAIRAEAIHTDGTHGQVDWLMYRVGSGPTLATVTIVPGSMGQGDGDPVEPETARYFDALVGATPVWALVLDDHRIGRLAFPSGADYKGVLAGTYDPGSDERPLYEIGPIFTGICRGYTIDTIPAADYSTLASPTFTAATVQAYKKDETGAWTTWAEVEAETIAEVATPPGKPVILADIDGTWTIVTEVCAVASGYS